MRKVNLEFELERELDKEIGTKKVGECLNKLLDDSKMMIISTRNGVLVLGPGPDIATGLTILIKNLREKLPDEVLKHAFDLAFKNDAEVMAETKSMAKEVLKKMKENLSKVKESEEQEADLKEDLKEILDLLKETIN